MFQHDEGPPARPFDKHSLGLEIFLCFAVYSAGHAFNRVYKPMLEKLRLTYPQYIAMVLLWERDGQTVGELGRKLLLEFEHAHAPAQAVGNARQCQAAA